MPAHTPDHDWWPEPWTGPHAGLPVSAALAARSLVRDLQAQLVEWRLLADRTVEPALRDALYRNLLAWQALLDEHQPDALGHCRRCRGRWGRPCTWPCPRFDDVATALAPRCG
jgi:hypothetical protein